MKFAKSTKIRANVFLAGLSLFSVMACTASNTKGGSNPKTPATASGPVVNNGAKDAADGTGKVECKAGEVLRGINADKTPICAPGQSGAQSGTVATDAKAVVENTTCAPGTADLTTFTSESNQTTELHVISISESVSPGDPVQVIVKKREKPVVLLLRGARKNWNTLKWHIKAEEGVEISKVYVFGETAVHSGVTGVDSAKIKEADYDYYDRGDAGSWTYPSVAATDVIDDAQKSTGLTLKKFQGCRVSNKFVIN